MLSREEFIRVSLETNLVFQRLMKEHLFFIETSLRPVEDANIQEAKILKMSLEHLLSETVVYADGVISEDSIESHEFVTPFTLRAEEATMELAGADINTDITKAELQLRSNSNSDYEDWLEGVVRDLNNRTLNILKEVIEFKEKILSLVENCEIFISLYHELIKHITEEAMLYQKTLMSLQNRELPEMELCEKLNFWNHIMGEHAQFIDGVLDPTEEELKEATEAFVERFEELIEECKKVSEEEIVKRSKVATKDIRDFKMAATEGLLECKIKAIIPPLLADHVLREANLYLRILDILED
ncbi:DUF2935 domain-containing protein [Tissierella creatinini]|nr:DUF2935 domain-containing protein [Tissierella creatinini]TJX62369.1 DUF2935 domain-containing protein [Soehngenia saccharolytica]